MLPRLSLLCSCAILCSFQAYSAEKQTPEQREAAEADAEDKAEVDAQAVGLKYIYEGKLELADVEEGKEPPAIIGTFTCDGKTYGLKLKSPDLYAELKKLSGKQVVLIGRPRNAEKYFVATNIQPPAAAPKYTRPRGAL
jgi:hypothetical protein